MNTYKLRISTCEKVHCSCLIFNICISIDMLVPIYYRLVLFRIILTVSNIFHQLCDIIIKVTSQLIWIIMYLW